MGDSKHYNTTITVSANFDERAWKTNDDKTTTILENLNKIKWEGVHKKQADIYQQSE